MGLLLLNMNPDFERSVSTHAPRIHQRLLDAIAVLFWGTCVSLLVVFSETEEVVYHS